MIKIVGTKQEIFDKVVKHAREQGVRSTDLEGNCRYKNPNGNKCFIGALIPDSEYSEDIEDKKVNSLIDSGKLYFGDRMFLQLIQTIHDKFSVSDWKAMFEVLAEEHGLEYKGGNHV